MLSLVAFLGSSNVFVSIVESGSLDDTKGALRDLEEGLKDLGVETKFVFGEDVYGQMESLKHVPSDKHGWIHTGRKQGDEGWEKRRIPHLAALRNQAMEPLLQVEQRFDRVLWINDVVFTVSHVLDKKECIDADGSRTRMLRRCWQRGRATMLLLARWISQKVLRLSKISSVSSLEHH